MSGAPDSWREEQMLEFASVIIIYINASVSKFIWVRMYLWL